MDVATDSSSPADSGVYSQVRANARIEITQAVIETKLLDSTYAMQSSVVMDFLPRPQLKFCCSGDGIGPELLIRLAFEQRQFDKLKLTSHGVEFNGFYAGVNADNTYLFLPRNSVVTATPPSNAIASARFHIFNFPNFAGPEDFIASTGTPPLQGAERRGRVTLKSDDWTIIITQTHLASELQQTLRTEGGYALTHVGEIRRCDGASFSDDDLHTLLNCLTYFLSFAMGRWTGIGFPVGFDALGKSVFQQWGLSLAADGYWKSSSSWFDDFHSELLSQVFPGFVKLWSNEMWRTPLAHAIYWYLGANDRRVGIGVDTGLILAQTALEGLAWTYCVLSRRMVSAAAFSHRGLRAADKLRLLATSLEIPTELPSNVPALCKYKPKQNSDSMDVITEIRNALVHSDASIHHPASVYFEAWKLSLWYLDLVLLRLCEHKGSYANRLNEDFTGIVRRVPWAVD
jgi:hypothetical protein